MRPLAEKLRTRQELISPYQEATDLQFSILATTTYAPLSLAVVDAPANAHLTLSAFNALAPVNLTLHPAFEGSLKLTTAPPFVPKVLWPDAVQMKDPAGLERPFIRWETGFDELQGILTGIVGWGYDADVKDRVWRGSATIWTNGSEAVLGWGESTTASALDVVDVGDLDRPCV